jgi:hypothetical protein
MKSLINTEYHYALATMLLDMRAVSLGTRDENGFEIFRYSGN